MVQGHTYKALFATQGAVGRDMDRVCTLERRQTDMARKITEVDGKVSKVLAAAATNAKRLDELSAMLAKFMGTTSSIGASITTSEYVVEAEAAVVALGRAAIVKDPAAKDGTIDADANAGEPFNRMGTGGDMDNAQKEEANSLGRQRTGRLATAASEQGSQDAKGEEKTVSPANDRKRTAVGECKDVAMDSPPRKASIMAEQRKSSTTSPTKIDALGSGAGEASTQVETTIASLPSVISHSTKLLVFNVQGTLLDCSLLSSQNPNSRIRPTLKHGGRRIVMRPWIGQFLGRCFSHFEVAF